MGIGRGRGRGVLPCLIPRSSKVDLLTCTVLFFSHVLIIDALLMGHMISILVACSKINAMRIQSRQPDMGAIARLASWLAKLLLINRNLSKINLVKYDGFMFCEPSRGRRT